MMSYTYWYELVDSLSDSEKADYLRSVFHKDVSFDPLHNLNDAWSLTENEAIEKVELEREGGSTYACLLTIDNTRFDMWCANTAQEAIVGAIMKAYDAGIRIW